MILFAEFLQEPERKGRGGETRVLERWLAEFRQDRGESMNFSFKFFSVFFCAIVSFENQKNYNNDGSIIFNLKINNERRENFFWNGYDTAKKGKIEMKSSSG